MNKDRKRLNLKAAALSAVVGTITAVSAITFGAPSSYGAGPELSGGYDWTFEIVTERLTRQFDYPGSQLKPVEKTVISFYPKNKTDEKQEYESIWFKNGQPLGLERKHKFDLPKGEGIRVKVKHKTATPQYEEYKAAANAVERVFLDAYLNKNPVEIVELKNPAFSPVSNALQARNWNILSDTTDMALSSTVNLHLKSEDDTKQTLYYPN